MGQGEPPSGEGEPPFGEGEPPLGVGEPPLGQGEPPLGEGEHPSVPYHSAGGNQCITPTPMTNFPSTPLCTLNDHLRLPMISGTLL